MSKLFYISLFILLFLLLQIGYSYHFFYIEQFSVVYVFGGLSV